jgi:competence protein ComEC
MGGGGGQALPPLAWLHRLLAASLVATAAGMPLTAYFFGQATPGGVLVNLVAVPAATLLVAVCALAMALAAVAPVLAAPLAPLASLAVNLLFLAADWPAHLPGGHLRLPPGRPALVLVALGALFASRRGPGGWRPAALLAAIAGQALLLGGWMPPQPLPAGTLTLRALDVGQGDALLVGLPNGEAILVDAGGLAGSQMDVGREVVLPALRAAGVRRLAAVALSHAHHDHGGGLAAVLEEMAVGELWLPGIPPGDRLIATLVDQAVARGVAVRVLRQGMQITRGGARIQCLGPSLARPRQAPNDGSLVLRLESEHGALLLPGDLEAPGEARLAGAQALAPATVLKVPHHGSRSSSSAEFLAAVRPQLAVISVGRTNPWGHPDPPVLERLGAGGAVILRTDRHGAVTVAITAAGPRWRTQKSWKP